MKLENSLGGKRAMKCDKCEKKISREPSNKIQISLDSFAMRIFDGEPVRQRRKKIDKRTINGGPDIVKSKK